MAEERPYLDDFLDSGAPHLEAFIAGAKYFLGLEENPLGSNQFTDSRGQEMFDLCHEAAIGANPPTAWCACLVTACEVIAEIDWKILGPGEGVGGITSYSVDQYGAEWIEGPFFTGGSVYPQTGDLISFVGYDDYGNATHYGYEHGGHIGIVEYVDDDGVHTIEGNCSDKCKRSGPYAFDNDHINGYVRADWAAMGDDVSEYVGEYTTSGSKRSSGKKKKKKKKKKGPLYTTRNDRHDMTLRQVGYLDGSYNLSNSSSGVAISVINYTALLGDLYEKFKPESFEEYEEDYENDVNVDTSELEGTVKECVDYLLKFDFSASAAAALTGYLYGCTQIQTAYIKDLGDMNGEAQLLQGIAGWPNNRWEWVKDRIYDNRYKLTGPGQLDCVIDELNEYYPELLDSIQYISLTPQSVQEAVEELVHNYNDYFDTEAAMERAKDKAAEIYKDLVITKQTYGYAGGKDLRDIDGLPLEPQFTVEVPADVPQAGIDKNFTSYSYWYCDSPDAWAAGTPQRRIADQWAYEGFPYDRGSIAVVGGYYCFGMAEDTFGDVGDIVVIELENGESFAGILADIKSKKDANYCEWGHYYPNGTVNMVEWERIATYEGKIALGDMTSSAGVDDIYLGSWEGQNIVRVTNYGSYGL